MRAGQLDTRGTFQTPTEGKDARGGRTITGWTTYQSVWAAVRPLTARERQAGPQVQAEVDYEIEIRTLAGLTPKMRFLADDGRVFKLHGIQPFPREGRILIQAQTV